MKYTFQGVLLWNFGTIDGGGCGGGGGGGEGGSARVAKMMIFDYEVLLKQE
jgi:hypothetical protein